MQLAIEAKVMDVARRPLHACTWTSAMGYHFRSWRIIGRDGTRRARADKRDLAPYELNIRALSADTRVEIRRDFRGRSINDDS
jgi:hypothetical protein